MRKLPKINTIQTTAKRKPTPAPKPAARGSNVLDHSYSPETGQLSVTFHGGRKYRYSNVSPEMAENLAKADSKGRFPPPPYHRRA